MRERGRSDEKRRLAAAIRADLACWAEVTGPRRLASLFFGGGTPSLMDPDDLAVVIECARALWPPAADLEISLEANPTDAEAGRFAAFAAAGVQRLSLGVQSLDDAALVFLGRNHSAREARRAAAIAADVFPRLSLDLMYALPGQSPRAWEDALGEALALGPEHLSCYQLTIEPGTAFDRRARRGAFTPADGEAAADLFETTGAVLGAAGFDAYEVSNHARGPAACSRHNLAYWRGEDWLGVGPGAHGRLTRDGRRWATEAPRSIGDYVAAVERGGAGGEPAALSAREAAVERLLMGLRITEGVPLADLAALPLDPARLADLAGFVSVEAGRLQATARGRPVLDTLIAALAAEG